MRIEQFDSLAKSASDLVRRSTFVDDNDIKLPGADIVKQSLQIGAIGGPPEYPPSS